MLRELLRIDPESESARIELAGLAARQRQFDDLHSQAQHAMQQQRFRDAQQLFQQVLAIRPDDATAIGRLGTVLAQRGARAEAEATLRRVAEVDPDDQYGWSMLAWLAYLDGDFQQAAEFYEKANAIEPFNSKVNRLWGSSLLKCDRLDEGIARLQIALHSDPKNLDAMRDLVDAYVQTSRLESAAEWAEQAARLTEHRSLRELMVLAECQLNLGRRDQAEDVVQLALNVAEGDAAATAQIEAWATQNLIRVSKP